MRHTSRAPITARCLSRYPPSIQAVTAAPPSMTSMQAPVLRANPVSSVAHCALSNRRRWFWSKAEASQRSSSGLSPTNHFSAISLCSCITRRQMQVLTPGRDLGQGAHEAAVSLFPDLPPRRAEQALPRVQAQIVPQSRSRLPARISHVGSVLQQNSPLARREPQEHFLYIPIAPQI